LSVNNDKNTIGIQQDSKVKVVDDDYDIAELVKMALQRDGFENVFAFTDPLLALEHFKVNREDYSLVISDIRMPGLNHGFEFAEYINKVKPEIKVILMSAFDINSDDIVKNFKYSRNISGMIQKPISPKKLAKIVAGTKVIGV
jgi:two-component system, cell cycle response regulator CpdR